jgi:oxygen-independent coproporphyrinogen-3 oxidase
VAGIYIHIPFCNRFCTYCNFYSVKGKALRNSFVAALHREIETKKHFFHGSGVTPQTVYVGGGTPSLLQASQLGEILSHIREAFNFIPVEATVEVNPDDITPQYALELFQAGFNRVSMGVQSFHDSHLQWMNRRHTGEQAVQAYRYLRDAGFANISLDLIFGYGGLSMQQWKENVGKMMELSPEHISAYQMSIEPGSALSKLLERGEYDLVPDSLCHEQYSVLQQMLSHGGYTQYEISNFARSSSEGNLLISKHNSSYWTKEPYLGLGPAAHSYNGRQRLWNGSSVTAYCRHYAEGAVGTMSGRPHAEFGGYEELTAEDVFNESIMLGLRTVEGVLLSSLDQSLLLEIKGEILRHCRLGNLVKDGDKIRIPSEKLFVSDGIIKDLFI